MVSFRQLLGKKGESIAVSFLKKNRYRIIEQNYKNRLGEIDIIARDRDTIAFIEVKTRSGNGFGSPKEAVTLKKQRHISRTAQAWLKSKRRTSAKARFDVVAIIMDGETEQIELVKNAFELQYR